MVSGFFFAFAVLRYGVTRWRERFINHEHSDIRIGPWWDWAIKLVAVEAVVLAVWSLWNAGDWREPSTWPLFSSYHIGTVIIQFVVVLAALIALNRWLAARVEAGGKGSATEKG